MNNSRPLSPHLQVYKLPLTGIISITHRMTGVMLCFGLILFVCIVSAIAGGEQAYNDLQGFLDNWLVRLIYWGFIYALFFHFCHGIRHLIWDVGKSFDLETMDQYAIYELIASFALTVITFIFI
jgi:succinate dehydrogenase / fumarate reductase cytochrome b subunit